MKYNLVIKYKMPRLAKYSSIKALSDPLREVDDNYLRAIEYSGFSYLIDVKGKGKSPMNKAVMLALIIGIYEYSLANYYAPKATEVKSTTKMVDKNGGKNK